MIDILALLQCLPPYRGATRVRQLSRIIKGMLAMTGRVTILYGKSVSGLSFFTLSLISVQQRHSFPLRVEQRVSTEEEKEKRRKNPVKKKAKGVNRPNSATERPVSPPGKSAPKNRGGRPKGSQTQNTTQVRLTPELLRIQGWIQGLLKQLGTV